MSDIELESIVSRLIANDRVVGLVHLMKPLDVVSVITKDLELCTDDAKIVTTNLLQHVHNVHYEGIASPAIETNKQYPVPPKLKRRNEKEGEVEESAGNYINITPTYVVMRHHFPPDPIAEPGGWPYDDMTTATMNPKNKGNKRPLMQGRNPLHPDLRKGQPGGDAGGGVHSKNAPHNRDNSTPVSGRSWDRKGSPGWSSSPPGKEFDMPDALEIPDELDLPDNLKGSPVGSPIPTLNYGGHGAHRRMGFRRR